MSFFWKISVCYFAGISLLSVWLTVHDKRAAVCRRRRTPERTLLLFATLGGSVAMYLTMRCIRHKTKHAKFMVGIPALIFLQILLAAAVWYLRNST